MENLTEYVPIKGIEELKGFMINRLGWVFNPTLGSIAKPTLTLQKFYQVAITTAPCVHRSYYLPKLLAFCFIPLLFPNTEYSSQKHRVIFINYDTTDIRIENLKWGTKEEAAAWKWKRLYDQSFINYPHPQGSLSIYPNAIPCLGHPGYFMFPNREARRAINQQGEVLNLITGLKAKITTTKTGYLAILHNTIRYKAETALIHRILAMLFIPLPERHKDKIFSELDINHKNGNKTDNSIENLEWVTNPENLEHYYRELAMPGKRFQVLVKNIRDNSIATLKSIYEASRHAFVSSVAMRKHLLSVFAGMVEKDGYVYKFDDGTDWPKILNSDESKPRLHQKSEISLSYTYDILAENVVTKDIYFFKSVMTACRILGLNHGSVENNRMYKGPDAPFKNWVFKPLSSEEIKNLLRGK